MMENDGNKEKTRTLMLVSSKKDKFFRLLKPN